MAVPKANQRAVNKYVKANYDRINVTMPKGEKEVVQACATIHGESVNGFIVRSIRERMERDGSGTASETAGKRQESVAGAGGISLSPDAMKTAQAAAEAAGEALEGFVARAVETQAKRDKASLKLGINPATGERLNQIKEGDGG